MAASCREWPWRILAIGAYIRGRSIKAANTCTCCVVARAPNFLLQYSCCITGASNLWSRSNTHRESMDESRDESRDKDPI